MADTASDDAREKRLAERYAKLLVSQAEEDAKRHAKLLVSQAEEDAKRNETLVEEKPFDSKAAFEESLDRLSPLAQLAVLRHGKSFQSESIPEDHTEDHTDEEPQGKSGRPPKLKQFVIPLYDKLRSEGKKGQVIKNTLEQQLNIKYASVKSMVSSIEQARARQNKKKPS